MFGATPISGKPTASKENVNAPMIAQETFDFIPPERGMPPKINATITSISNPVPVESDAAPVYPIWNIAASTSKQYII